MSQLDFCDDRHIYTSGYVRGRGWSFRLESGITPVSHARSYHSCLWPVVTEYDRLDSEHAVFEAPDQGNLSELSESVLLL